MARLDLKSVPAGLHELVANAVLKAPKSKRTSTKQVRYLFQVCP